MRNILLIFMYFSAYLFIGAVLAALIFPGKEIDVKRAIAYFWPVFIFFAVFYIPICMIREAIIKATIAYRIRRIKKAREKALYDTLHHK